MTENDLRDCENEAIAALANVRSPYVKGLAQRVGQLAQSHRMLARAHADCPDADELARLRAVVDAGQGDGGSPSERQRRGVLGRKDGGHALSLRRLHHVIGGGGRPCAGGQVTPAVVRHPAEIIREELEARGWSVQNLCLAADTDDAVSRLAWEIYLGCGLESPGDVLLGDEGAAQLARAFGTSPEFWLNLEAAWLKSLPPDEEGETCA